MGFPPTSSALKKLFTTSWIFSKQKSSIVISITMQCVSNLFHQIAPLPHPLLTPLLHQTPIKRCLFRKEHSINSLSVMNPFCIFGDYYITRHHPWQQCPKSSRRKFLFFPPHEVRGERVRKKSTERLMISSYREWLIRDNGKRQKDMSSVWHESNYLSF